MIKLRHILHPLQSTKSLYDRLNLFVFKQYVKRQFLKIPRGKRDNCWCGGVLQNFPWHDSYGICCNCGCYVNRKPAQDLDKLYKSKFYWHMAQKYHGYPPIESRAALYRKDGRLSYWLQLISRFCPSQGNVIEVGCAPGVLLSNLEAEGYKCIGVEPDRKTATWIHENMNVNVLHGLFPDIDLLKCDIFLAFDVLEHSMFPDRFMYKVSQLLNNRGIAIIQTPIERYGYQPPFGEMFQSAFNEIEHLFLFTPKSINLLASQSGLEIIEATERLWLHHEVVVLRKSDA